MTPYRHPVSQQVERESVRQNQLRWGRCLFSSVFIKFVSASYTSVIMLFVCLTSTKRTPNTKTPTHNNNTFSNCQSTRRANPEYSLASHIKILPIARSGLPRTTLRTSMPSPALSQGTYQHIQTNIERVLTHTY